MYQPRGDVRSCHR